MDANEKLRELASKHVEAEGDVIREALLNGVVPAHYGMALVNASRELFVAYHEISEALRHDLTTVAGMYATDKAPVDMTDFVRLEFKSLAAPTASEETR